MAPAFTRRASLVAVKMPVFSFEKLIDADTSLGPEMKSTGEVLGVSPDCARRSTRPSWAQGLKLHPHGKVLCSVNNHDKAELRELAAGYEELGYHLMATPALQRT